VVSKNYEFNIVEKIGNANVRRGEGCVCGAWEGRGPRALRANASANGWWRWGWMGGVDGGEGLKIGRVRRTEFTDGP
jgi:hypothetical protein